MAAPSGRVFRRNGESLEFERVVNFSDAIYAIAMTLIVVGIGIPTVRHTTSSKDFLDGLWDKNPEIISFFISFLVLGNFWIAHNRFVARLDAMDSRLRLWNLVYLAFVSFLPFPTLLLGQYVENSAAVAFYAVSVGAISALETVAFVHAHRAHLNRKQMSDAVAKWGRRASALPVVCFALSVPVAFLSPLAGILTWTLAFPAQMVLNRYKPPDADQYFE